MPRALVQLACLIAAAVLVGLAAPDRARALEPPAPHGFNDNAVAQKLVTPERNARLAGRIGASVHRFTFDWRWAEPSPGDWRLDIYDEIYAADVSRGIRPVFILLFAPQWTWAPGTPCIQATQDCRYPPAVEHLDAWRTLVRTLIRRYPRMAAIEVWNEPNLAVFWYPWPDPAHYTRLVQEARLAVRDAGSDVPVLAGSLSNAPAGGYIKGIGARDFLAGMYASGAAGHYDGLAVHPYPEGQDLAPALRTMTEIRDLRDAAGDRTPMWITETGATTTAGSRGLVTEGQQAQLLDRLVDLFGGMPDVEAVLLHTLLDPAFGPGNHETGYGVALSDGTPKPAFCALADLRAPACPALPRPGGDEVLERRVDAQVAVQRAVDVARAQRARTGSFAGLDSAALHAADPRLSARPADGDLPPGPRADPARIGVYPIGDGLLLCATSRADRSYCAGSGEPGRWTYGHAAGPVFAAARATTVGSSTNW